jgi:hypothetical protein
MASNSEGDGVDNMEGIERIVGEIVDNRLIVFKSQLDIDFALIRVAVKSHEESITEIRAGNLMLSQGQSRIEGRLESYTEEQRANHLENREIAVESRKETAELVRLLHAHVGEDRGKEKHKAETDTQQDRNADKRRAWFKIALGVGTSGGVIKWIHDHWDSIRH